MVPLSTCLLVLLLSCRNVIGDSTPAPVPQPQPDPVTAPPPTDPPTDPPPPPQQPVAAPSNPTGNPTDLCPSNKAIAQVGCPSTPCAKESICYRDMRQNSVSVSGCCDELSKFCPATEMHTFRSKGNNGFLYHYRDSPSGYYMREFAASGHEGVACPYPHSYVLNRNDDKDLSTLPVDWDLAKAQKDGFTLHKCKQNSDCQAGEFCGEVYNPSFTAANGDFKPDGLDKSLAGGSVKFCYKQPPTEDRMSHVTVENGLKLCNIHSDCGVPNEVCHIVPGKPFRDQRQEGKTKGVCMTVAICEANQLHPTGFLTKANQFCTSPTSCEGAGNSNKSHNPHCVSYSKSDDQSKLCCFEINPTCRKGDAVTPIQKCKKYSDCTDVTKGNPFEWCDDGENKPKVCCRDHENKLWQCPDLATPLFNEPFCEGWLDDNENSGKCPQKGGICVRGHCCPPLVITKNGTSVKLGKELYKTNVPCKQNEPVPATFSYAFCDEKSSKVIVVGNFHTNGDKMTKLSGTKCTLNEDCSTDGSQVCVYENEKVHMCYYNPFRPLRPEVSSFWKSVLIASLICGAIFLISSIICFVCYRSKSVFDKYRPKKKKKGDKRSDSKSKSTKSGKKGKKKDGKKGKKSEDGSSHSSKKDTTETGKSEMTDATGKSQVN